MELSDLKLKIRENRKYRYGAIIVAVLILVGFGFLIKEALSPRIPEVPLEFRQDIVGYWAFEKEDQLVYDSSLNNNDGRLGSSYNPDKEDPQPAAGKIGKGLAFKNQDYVLIPFHPSLNLKQEISLEAWVKPVASPPFSSLLWLQGWNYRRMLVIKNEGRDSFKDSQIKLSLNTKQLIDKGKMEPDCKDIRFTDTDKTTLVNHWVKKGCNSTSTEIFVKIPSLKANSEKPIYFYYGNPDASSKSDFYETMESPPLKYWTWPFKRTGRDQEKIYSLDIDSKNNIIAGGYQKDRYSGETGWGIVKLSHDNYQLWYRIRNYSSEADQLNSVGIDSKNNVILGGFDYSLGNSQWRVEKMNSYGVDVFSYTSNPSPGSDQITSLAVDSQDNIILGGFDYSQGNSQWRVEKLNSKGEQLWTYQENPSSDSDVINALAIDSQDNIILGGFDKSLGNDRWVVVKLNPKGELIFKYLLNISEGSDVVTAITTDSQDNIIVAGYDFKMGDFQWKAVKLNPEGKRLWSYTSNPSPGSDQITSLAIDSQDNIILGGFDYSLGNSQWRVEKLNSKGEQLWTYQENPSSDSDVINSLAIDSQDNIILGGFDLYSNFSMFRIEKISEKKEPSLQLKTSIFKEERPKAFPQNIIVGKLDSYLIRANLSQAVGSINNNSISAPLEEKQWHHIVLTFDGSQQKLYINSKLKASQALTESISSNYNNLVIGFNYSGVIDEVKVYKKALTSGEVQKVYSGD